jgi:hypothetical protein
LLKLPLYLVFLPVKKKKPRSQNSLFTGENSLFTGENSLFTGENSLFTGEAKPTNPHKIRACWTFKNPNILSIDNQLIINQHSPPALTGRAYAII